MGAMAMGFATRRGSVAHPFSFPTSPWVFSNLRRAVFGLPWSSDSRSSSYSKGRAEVCAKDMWLLASFLLRCNKILHQFETGRINMPSQDFHRKNERAISVLGHLVDGRNNVLVSDFQGKTPQVSLCSYTSGRSSIYKYDVNYFHEQSVSSLGTDGRMVPQLAFPEKSLLNVQGPQNNHLVAAPNSVYDKDAHSEETSVHGKHIGISSKMLLPDENLDKVVDQKRLASIYDKVIVVDNLSTAKEVVQVLTSRYKNFVHACDTEVAGINVKSETPVGHGEIICFSIYSGPLADFGNGKSCIWVDVLDGGRNLLMEFVPFFEDSSIKKVWHNYSFDSHVLENFGIKPSGFYADTMHLARLLDSSRRDGGYSLEALTNDPNIMSSGRSDTVDELSVGKRSMGSIFRKKKQRKDGSEGKVFIIAPVDVLQREERIPWICYSVYDSIKTLELFNSLKAKLNHKTWTFNGDERGTMYDFYEQYWRPFGALLVQMESEGMLVDREYLSNIERLAIAEQQIAADKFRTWASKYCPDAKFMNIGSDTQIRQLLFGNASKRKGQIELDPEPNFQSKSFKVLNSENISKEGKKCPRCITIVLHKICKDLKIDMYTPSGLPSVSSDALKVFAGKVATDRSFLYGTACTVGEDTSAYGTAYEAFGGGMKGREACQAIAALCEVSSIDSLISNFILPLQGEHISCAKGRVHCSLNINTETGRLSARRPSLQNQPALEKDRYKIRQAFIAKPGNSLIVADYGQLELRILAHLANCKSMLEAFRAGGDFHSRTAMNMYAHVRKAVEENRVLLEWHPQPGEVKPPVPLLKDAFAAERRKAKMLNFSIAYGKTPVGLSRDWKVSVREARETVKLWYKDRPEVRRWQEARKKEASQVHCVKTLLGRSRNFPQIINGHIERAAINTPVQGSAADVAMCAMLEIDRNIRLKKLGWRLLLQVHDEVILEGPTESADLAKGIVIECMSKPFSGENLLKVDLVVDAKIAQNWYAAK